ncbi:MAG: bifunctional phosphoribosylaminoimidazolecarboxamide formyltransferase/IMP cyclohydrolase [Leptospirales bacterium]|nr:bifunctional phosphoribosylaminoimidazolecarboxamide formyltransferase/IMP cyclohydrolase [Leptospirales bacterium]
MSEIKRALLSVSDKSGLIELAQYLSGRGVQLISTGGTLKALQSAGIAAQAIEDYTGFPEIMDGRVKTLHPRIHGGLLGLLDQDSHRKAMSDHNIESIDLLVVNLYPFAQTIVRSDASFEDAIENIDIGGPAMLRAAAKNYGFTTVVCDPADYAALRQAIEGDALHQEYRLALARKVFNHTAAYDAMIAEYLNQKAGETFPERTTITLQRNMSLRYGENPHQQAALYRPAIEAAREAAGGRAGIEQLQGKELSYNNMLDFNAALRTSLELPAAGAVIVKHLNPCGASVVESAAAYGSRLQPGELQAAFLRARACDPISAFGGIIALGAVCDAATAASINENFAEVIVAPDFEDEALKLFSEKKNLRLLRVAAPERYRAPSMEARWIAGGVLLQERDASLVMRQDWKLVAGAGLDQGLARALDFAWRVVKHVKSNAIVFASELATLGVGAGQMSRVDSVQIAASKAARAGLSLQGSVAASDAFFPFRDGLDVLADAGARAVIQPGGSVRDDEVIAAANERGVTMVFTGMRHFLH